ncbi:phage tail protein [Aeromonas rivuli]|uniref:phage tail protein n=1 Tax=Aeromonas rivuli TaxID=648794 RepID=UPI00069391C2|nr:phage tail protein [Aeromonas rivuli]
MYWLDNDSGVASPPAIPPVQSLTRLYFTEGGGGEQPSIPGGEWFNMLTDEMLNVLTLAGVTPDKADHAQLSKAMQALAFSAYPVGAPIPWPTAVPPDGFLAMTGQSFSATTYPLLALAYPALVLPDMRAEWIRGWDNGRGVDPGRALRSAQGDAARALTGSFTFVDQAAAYGGTDVFSGVFSGANNVLSKTISTSSLVNASGGVTARYSRVDLNTASVTPTAPEYRPRNIAFNYIVRAA